MPRLIRLIPALGAFFVAAIVFAGCGEDLPGNAVANVDDKPITRSEFIHWMEIAKATSQGSSSSAEANYDPPDFTACVAKLRETAPKPAKGQPKANDAALKSQCKKDYEGFRDQALRFLITERWIRGEAGAQGVKLTEEQVDAEFEKARKQQYPKDADFQKFLKQTSQTVEDLKRQLSLNTLSTKLRTKVVKDAEPITDKRVADYYKKNKERFAEPEKRDVRLVVTKTKAKADQALEALRDDESWKAVTRRLSIDPSTKSKGGAVTGLTKGQQDPAVDGAIFGAAKGKLVGPIKTQFGHYVVQVQKIVPAKERSLKQATSMIEQQLKAEGEQEAIKKFSEDLSKKWKAKTYCREGYVTQDCKNAPKPKTTATQPGQPQQPQQPQQPPQPQPQP